MGHFLKIISKKLLCAPVTYVHSAFYHGVFKKMAARINMQKYEY